MLIYSNDGMNEEGLRGQTIDKILLIEQPSGLEVVLVGPVVGENTAKVAGGQSAVLDDLLGMQVGDAIPSPPPGRPMEWVHWTRFETLPFVPRQ